MLLLLLLLMLLLMLMLMLLLLLLLLLLLMLMLVMLLLLLLLLLMLMLVLSRGRSYAGFVLQLFRNKRGETNMTQQKIVCTAAEAAQMLSIGKSTLWLHVKLGALPAPIKIGGATRWRVADLARAVEKMQPTQQGAT